MTRSGVHHVGLSAEDYALQCRGYMIGSSSYCNIISNSGPE